MRFAVIICVLLLGLLAMATHAATATLPIASGIVFQDNDGTGAEQKDFTSALLSQDGVWAPAADATHQSFIANGVGSSFWDAISVHFNGPTLQPNEVMVSANLRFYIQKGELSNNTWQHYLVLSGAFNPAYEDSNPVGTNVNTSLDLPSGTVVGWRSVDVTQDIAAGTRDFTLRFWNFRVDAVELQVETTVIPEPSGILALATGVFGLGGMFLRRRK